MSRFIAFRGGKPLSEEEFSSHLASLTRVENVGIFLGAGASKDCGGKLIREIWSSFCEEYKESAQWLHSKRFVLDADLTDDAKTNIETLLEILQTAEQEWRRQNPNGRNLKALQDHRDNLYRAILKGATLQEELWDDPGQILEHTSLDNHRQLLCRVVAGRQPGQPAPWVFTINYDLSVEWASESLGLQIINGFGGLHYRNFDSSNFDLGYRNMQAKGEARFGVYNVYLAKLHGSMSWIKTEKGSVRELTTDALKPLIFDFVEKKKPNWPGLIIFPNAAKYVQTTGYIYGELIRRFSEFLSRPQATLIINGYSFGDEHINRVLTSALQNPTLQLVLYVPEYSGSNGTTNDEMHIIENTWLQAMIRSKHPRVTIVGGGEQAHFKNFVAHLPEPVLLDQQSKNTRRIMKELEEVNKPVQASYQEELPATPIEGEQLEDSLDF